MTKNVGKPWRSSIGQGSGDSFEDLGVFATEEKAGRAYDVAIIGPMEIWYNLISLRNTLNGKKLKK